MRRVVKILLSLAIILPICLAGGAWAAEYREGEALVVIRNQSGGEGVRTQAAIEASAVRVADSAAKSAGASVGRVYAHISPAGDVYALVKSDTKTTEQLMAELRANPDVLAVSPNRIVKAFGSPGDYNNLTTDKKWGLTKINAPAAWDWNNTDAWGDRGIKIAVMDSGIDSAHPDFVDSGGTSNLDTANSECFFGNSNDYNTDKLNHGTHVSGIIGAAQNGVGIIGVSPLTSMIMLRVVEDDSESNKNNSIDNVIAALNRISRLIQQGEKIKAVNISLGWYYNTNAPGDLLHTVEYKAFKELDSRTDAPVIVVAAGNDKVDVGTVMS
ncbi:MAG: S8 family serine peptidase, partial [Synergistaceae bacterium]|nr:S8 family serine peptidase [Synergistaceae bacterium]